MKPVQTFIRSLQKLDDSPNLFNPWKDYHREHDGYADAPKVRVRHLQSYLEAREGDAKLILVAEAPGYRGCRFSGIAMTSERILLGHQRDIPHEVVFIGEKKQTSQNTQQAQGWAEPTATIVWSTLLGMGLDPMSFILWNAHPIHPFEPGDPMSNRKPEPSEVTRAKHLLPELMDIAPKAKLIAIGNVAAETLLNMGITVPKVRHPSRSGASEFRTQIKTLLQN
jgi:uracil-DNA glycosylase